MDPFFFDIDQKLKIESSIDNNNENNDNLFNKEIEYKWKQIEQNRIEKLKNRTKKIDNKKTIEVNNIEIFKPDLNSLLHEYSDKPTEFEKYCFSKIDELEKLKQSIDSDLDVSVLKNMCLKKNSKLLYKNSRNPKIQLNDLINQTKGKNKNKLSNTNKIFQMLNLDKINKTKNSFLKSDDDEESYSFNNMNLNTIGGGNIRNTPPIYMKYKQYNTNSRINTEKNRLLRDNNIRDKIEKGYKYFYNLYPSLKKKKYK